MNICFVDDLVIFIVGSFNFVIFIVFVNVVYDVVVVVVVVVVAVVVPRSIKLEWFVASCVVWLTVVGCVVILAFTITRGG